MPDSRSDLLKWLPREAALATYAAFFRSFFLLIDKVPII